LCLYPSCDQTSTHTHTHIRTHALTNTHTHTHTCIHTYTYTQIHTYIRTCIHTYILYSQVHASQTFCIHTYMHLKHTNILMYTCIRTYICTHTYACNMYANALVDSSCSNTLPPHTCSLFHPNLTPTAHHEAGPKEEDCQSCSTGTYRQEQRAVHLCVQGVGKDSKQHNQRHQRRAAQASVCVGDAHLPVQGDFPERTNVWLGLHHS